MTGSIGTTRSVVAAALAALLGVTLVLAAGPLGREAKAQESESERHASTVWWAPDSSRRTSVGSVMAAEGCDEFRTVVLKKRRPGRDRTFGRAVTDRKNNWKIKHRKLRNGAFYVVVRKKEFTRDDGTLVVCQRDRSPNERY